MVERGEIIDLKTAYGLTLRLSMESVDSGDVLDRTRRIGPASAGTPIRALARGWTCPLERVTFRVGRTTSVDTG